MNGLLTAQYAIWGALASKRDRQGELTPHQGEIEPQHWNATLVNRQTSASVPSQSLRQGVDLRMGTFPRLKAVTGQPGDMLGKSIGRFGENHQRLGRTQIDQLC